MRPLRQRDFKLWDMLSRQCLRRLQSWLFALYGKRNDSPMLHMQYYKLCLMQLYKCLLLML